MSSRPPGKSDRRVLLIGLDSADAELIEQWMEAGAMPAFRALRENGMWSRLGTTAEVMHVSAWPTLYTGTTPGQHGLYHAYQITAGAQEIHRAYPETAGRPPFWKYLDDAGRKCVILDAFMNYRLEGFKGVQILDYGTWTWFGEPGSTPRGMLNDIKRRFGPYPAPEHSNCVKVPDDPLAFRDQLVAGTEVKSKVVRSLMGEQNWDFMFVTFGEPHGAGHYLWHVEDGAYPSHPASGPLSVAHPVRDVYTALDKAIGEIVAAADDNTTVIITSGDGMGPNYSGCHLMPEMLHKMGLFYSGSVGGGDRKATAAPKKGLLSSLRQAVPLELRQSVTRCLPRSLRYKISMKWVNSGIDWSRSKVFCIPNSNEGYFRVNLSGREPQGIVRAGTEYDEILGRLTEELNTMVNPVNGMRAPERVARVDDVFSGPRRKNLPDAVISWNLDARVTDQVSTADVGRIAGPAGHAISPFYTGNHRATAFALARGPKIASDGSLDRGHILDIAPTILGLLGVDAPAHFEGRAWPSFL
ncbi:MAG: alkaline phosphatase family protein [Gammaproteobacteria bacterium]